MEETAVHAPSTTVVAVLADDLIWSSRLRAAIERAGASATSVRAADDVSTPFAVIDLGGRAYDGIEAVRIVAARGATVLAVAQHEDVKLRKQALAAGARRVLSYNKMFSDGPDVIARFIGGAL